MTNCAQCGDQLPEGAGSCARCGAEQLSAAPPRRWSWYSLVAWLGLVAVAGGLVAAYIFFFNLTPRQLLLTANYRYLTTALRDLDADLYTQIQQRLLSDPSHSTVTLSAGVIAPPAYRGEVEPIQRWLEKSSLVIESQKDPATNRSLSGLTVNLRGTELIAGQFYSSDEQIGLRIPALYDKYLVLENQNLGAFFDKLGIPYSGPDRLTSSKEYQETVKWEELAPVAVDYGKFLLSTIRDEDMTLEKGVEYQSPSGPVKLRRVTVFVPEARIKEQLRDLGRKLHDDEQALDLLAESIGGVAKAAEESSDPLTAVELRRMQEKEHVKGEIREGIKEWERSIEELRFPEGLNVVLWVDRTGKLVHQSIAFAIGDQYEQINLELTMTDWKGSDAHERSLTAAAWPRGASRELNEARFELNSRSTTPSRKERLTQTNFSASVMEQGYLELKLKGELATHVQKDAEPDKDKTTRDLTVAVGDRYGESSINAKLVNLLSNQIKENRFEGTHELTLSGQDDRGSIPPVALHFKAESVVQFQPDRSLPVFDESNAFDLTAASQQELEGLAYEIIQALELFMERNAHLFY